MFAKIVFDLVKQHGPISRRLLESFLLCNDLHKLHNDLSAVIKSLVAFKHVDRQYDEKTNQLIVWVRGLPSPGYTAMESVVSQLGILDYLDLHNQAVSLDSADVVENVAGVEPLNFVKATLENRVVKGRGWTASVDHKADGRTRYGLSLIREDGSKIDFTDAEAEALELTLNRR